MKNSISNFTKKLLASVFAMMLSISIFAVESEDALKAASLYNEGNYSEAAELYKSIEDAGYVSADLYFNLGNSYFKAGELPNAILYYERALMLEPKNENVLYNRELAQQYVVDKIDVVDEFFLNKWLVDVRKSQSSDMWAYFSLIGFALFAIALFIYFFSSSSGLKRAAFYLGLIFVIGGSVAMNSSSKEKKRFVERKEAIIFSPTVTLKSAPDNSSTDLFILHEGTKVEIRDGVGEWYEIQMADGNVGWLQKESLEKI